MAALFNLKVLLPNKVLYDDDISSLVVPAENGYLGVLAHHAPIIARLKPGNITLRDSSGAITRLASTGSGFLEVSGNKATLLVDSLELPA